MKNIPAPLAALESYGKRFLICRVNRERTTEVVNSLGELVDPSDALHWVSFRSALAASALMGADHCAGLVLDGSGIFVFELPSCDGGAERFESLRQILAPLSGACLCMIDNKRGIRLMGRYQERHKHLTTNSELQIELHTGGVVPLPLGLDYSGDAMKDCSAAFVDLILSRFSAAEKAPNVGNA